LMCYGRNRSRAERLAGWLLVLVFAGARVTAVWSQEAPVSSSSSEEIRLVDKMLEAKTSNEKLDLAKRVLKLNPNNEAALKIWEEASRDIKSQEKEAEKQKQDEIDQRQKKAEGQKAVDQGMRALAKGDTQGASHFLNLARQLGAGGLLVDNLERNIALKNRARTFVQALTIGSAAAVVGALAGVLLWFKRKKVAYLELTEGSRKGIRFRLDRELTNIGAVEEYGETRNDVVIPDKFGAISRLHCQVRIKGGKPYLIDCNSANGTYLNGQRVPPRRLVPLKSGAQIDLAHSSTMRVGFERKKG
jgi:FHA domain